MIRTTDLLRIVLRQQVRQINYGVILAVAFGICIYLSMGILGKEIETLIGQDINFIGGVSVIKASLEEHYFPDAPPQFFAPAVLEHVRSLPQVLSASASMRRVCWVPMTVGQRQFDLYVLGVDPWFWETNSITAFQGRLLDAADEAKRTRVCVLGREIAQILFGEGPYVGRIVGIQNDNYEVVGLGTGIMLRGNWCFIPLGTAMDRGIFDAAPNRMQLRMRRLEDVEPMAQIIPDIVSQKQQSLHLKVEFAGEDLRKVLGIVRWVRILLTLGIASSLILGCMGIWQGTFATVRERTREVGLKLAMGAERWDIWAQFLGEAICKSVLGGILGIVLGAVCIYITGFFLHIPIVWTKFGQDSLLCVGAATLVGVVGGMYPAILASRMDAVHALRYE
jgi:putative ABC transport system permease protein